MKTQVAIIGAGISGLAAAYWLYRDGIDVTVLEKNGRCGGTMETEARDGYLFDRGPNSGLETTPLIRELVDGIGLSGEMVYADESAGKRYILRNNRLYPLPTGLLSFVRTGLFSVRGKLRLLAEPFIGRPDNGGGQSVAGFVRRRLGQEFLDYAINPFVAGVYAGNPENLSVQSAFPKLYRLEEVHGGLVKGMIKGARERKKRHEVSKQSARMFSFRTGMHAFPDAVSRELGERVLLNTPVKAVFPQTTGFVIECADTRIESEALLSTVPAFCASGLFQDMDKKLADHLNAIEYPPVLVLFLGYNQSAVKRRLDGFGFLIPEKEQKSFLGAIWSSVIFPGRADEGHVSFTLFIGGARSPGVCGGEREALVRKVLDEFHEIMHISEEPVFSVQRMWENAIPQYDLRHHDHELYFRHFEQNHPGIFLGGNYRGGISVGDCIKSSREHSRNLKNYLSRAGK